MSEQNEEFQAEAGQQGGAGAFPTPRPTVRERSKRFFVRLPTDVDATEGVGAEPVAEELGELAADPDAVTQETPYQGWSPTAGYATDDRPADAYGYPAQEIVYEAEPEPQAQQPAWGDYVQEAPAGYDGDAGLYEAGPEQQPEQPVWAEGAQAVAPAYDGAAYEPVDPTQSDEAPSELPERPLAEQEYIPEAYDMQAYPAEAAAPAAEQPPPAPLAGAESIWQAEPAAPAPELATEPEPLAAEPQPVLENEPFPEPSQFLGSTAQEAFAGAAPAWPGPESGTEPELAASELPAEVAAAAEIPAETPFGGQPAWATPAAPEPTSSPATPEQPVEPAAPGFEAGPSWSFTRPQAEAPLEAPATVAEATAPQAAAEQPVFAQPPVEPAPYEQPAPEPPAEAPAPASEQPAGSGWTPPAKDWSTGPSWGGSRNATKPKPQQAPSLLEDPVAAVGLYIPGDVERFEGDMPLFGDGDVMAPLWQGEGLGEPLFVDFNDLPQMLAGLRQLLPKGTRLTYNYDHERAWIRSLRDIDLAAYAESVKTLMWEKDGAGTPEQASS